MDIAILGAGSLGSVIGGRLHCVFHVGHMRRTRKPGWGIVHLVSELINQNGEVVQKGEHKLMILRNPVAGGTAA